MINRKVCYNTSFQSFTDLSTFPYRNVYFTKPLLPRSLRLSWGSEPLISHLLLVFLMDDHLHMISSFLTPIFTLSFFFLFVITLPTLSICQEHNKYEVCTTPYTCGELTNIYYPFWGDTRPSYCGRNKQFEIKCEGNQNTSIQIGSQSFKVLQIDQLGYTMRMARKGLVYDHCSSGLSNTSLNSEFFHYMPNVTSITIFYDCPETALRNGRNSFPCKEGMNKSAVYVDHATAEQVQNCRGVSIEVKLSHEVDDNVGGIEGLNKALDAGFDVNYDSGYQVCLRCLLSNGTCGSNDKSQFSCYCKDGSEASDCSHHHSSQWNWKRKVGVGVTAAVVSGVAVGLAIYIYYRQKKKKKKILLAVSSVLSKSFSSGTSLEDIERGHKYPGLHYFTYNELEEATNNFDSARKLGDGGFGTVYFGKLQDERLIAVKRMAENSWRRVEQFMNEVENLTGLHHQNLVSLYGCTSRHSRELLLVYEYVPNGTVADHIHGPQAKPGQLSWHIRMNIAIETASALVYLHATDIIHRDVKTRNILLDNHYSVKVADFGLSRLLPDHLTHISTAPQGTPGYVDPEYNECYQLTDKSDVYSFGVVLIELISSMPAVDISRERREIKLSTMAIKKIRNGTLHELVDSNLGFESDFKVRKMINAVAELAFQCLQSSKDVRPSMAEVLERLRDIQSDGKYESKPEVMDIPEDDAALLKYEPPQSPDSNLRNISTPPNRSE